MEFMTKQDTLNTPNHRKPQISRL